MKAKLLLCGLPLTLAASLVLFTTGIARADSIYTVTLEQMGNNVVATGSGSFNLGGLGFDKTGTGYGGLDPANAVVSVGLPSYVYVYTGITGPTSFGSGILTAPTSGSGDFVELAGSPAAGYLLPVLVVPYVYVSGTSLGTSTATWDNTTLSALGVTDGIYTWTWDNGTSSFVLDIRPVPEPSSIALFATGVLSLLGIGLCRKWLM